MDSRADLKRQYKETKPEAGIFQVKNTANGKVFLGSSTNLHGPLNKHRFMLKIGHHDNKQLQKDWDTLGPDAFEFELLEVVQVKDEPTFSLDDELTLLEQIWLEKLEPYGERGYNTKGKRLRE
ncbi:GIY-YIG nuclease family protein [Sorangium cellulosum]|uniref:GIY-YIG domain-containing protein n=1 Tax=Sorangium cellulosum TaxID=56 RepID=A0A150R1T9_SORCE|nr:GIY-YIG nuclease family protein [Sorangium cellulosum]KYF74091.1 hypothetical protein BE15_02640 [Sorangium cellulosum]